MGNERQFKILEDTKITQSKKKRVSKIFLLLISKEITNRFHPINFLIVINSSSYLVNSHSMLAVTLRAPCFAVILFRL